MPLSNSSSLRHLWRALRYTRVHDLCNPTIQQTRRRLTAGPCPQYGSIVVFSFIPAVKLAYCAVNQSAKPDSGTPLPLALYADLGPAANLKDVCKIADTLYDKHNIEELYMLLEQFRDTDDADIQWRLARVLYEKSQAATVKEEKKSLMYAAFDASKRAVAAGGGNFACHKWYAILLDEIGKFKGTKFRLQRSPEVKEHFEKAIALNPSDPTSHHCLGYWHYSFADLAWYTRQAAAAFFATPPTSTYEEAIKCFEHAEQVQPNFYSMNLLMLGKAHMKIHNYQHAVVYLTRLQQYKPETAEDRKALEEGNQLLQEAIKKSQS
ncbi:regulator of microtubule dynamics protein 1-like [Paramacrobiotus metropolitanus]|uniref:regulator of microtubule dynamics protein 1-like n=1 Tax=Paramacrobiotus metropolitanus TaxID=2943436 RepID=UPI002445607F|nr:regulator of microtubule dynamics protein 1-like [Paramacrobiotus metropolitanus]